MKIPVNKFCLMFFHIFVLAALLSGCETQNLKQAGDIIIKEINKQQASNKVSSPVPTTEEMVKAIKQALIKGSAQAVDTLGTSGGFLNSKQYHIPLPDPLQKVSSNLRAIGLGKYVDEFDQTMNKAAEKAVPEAMDVFKNMISKMTVTDALALIKGKENAVTEYFKKTQDSELKQRFLPIVSRATAEVGVTNLYNKLQAQANLFGANLPDTNNYVTDYALKALYGEFARVEKEIRKDPLARTTALLKKVFGYYQPK